MDKIAKLKFSDIIFYALSLLGVIAIILIILKTLGIIGVVK